MDKAGLTEEQAKIAVETTVSYLKDRIPQIIHQQFDKIVAGQSLEQSIKSQVNELGGEVRERTEGLAKDLKTAFEGAFGSKKSNP